MNKEFALDILSTAERGTIASGCSLAREACVYLERLKSTRNDKELQERIYAIRHNRQW